MDIYKCEGCGEIFDEFEMNFKAAQEDKKELCRKCRKQLDPSPERAKERGKIMLKKGRENEQSCD